jgi:hypothetical protein
VTRPMHAGSRWGGLWHQANFRLLWTAQTISLFGSQVTFLALPLTAAVVLQASPTQMGMLGALQYLAFPVIGLFAGVWVDRRRRRPILVASEAWFRFNLSPSGDYSEAPHFRQSAGPGNVMFCVTLTDVVARVWAHARSVPGRTAPGTGRPELARQEPQRGRSACSSSAPCPPPSSPACSRLPRRVLCCDGVS